MKNLKLLYVFILIASSISCKDDDSSENPIDSNLIDPPTQVKAIAQVIIPGEVPDEAIGDLEIVSGFYSNPVKDEVSLTDRAPIEKQCKLVTFENSVQIHQILNNGSPFLSIITSDIIENQQNIVIDAESTAISLLFTHPTLLTTDINEANYMIEKIKQAPSFQNLVDEVKSLLITGSINLITPNIDQENLRNYKYVLTEVYASMSENYFINQNGLELINVNKNGNEITFKVKNFKKRNIAIFADKYNNGVETNTDITSSIPFAPRMLYSEPFEMVYSGDFSWQKAWKDIFNRQLTDQITTISEKFTVNVSDSEKLYIRGYGLGFRNGSLTNMTSQEFVRGSSALALTAYFDYLVPITELFTGLKSNSGKASIVGRPNNDPAIKILNKYMEELNEINFKTYVQQLINQLGEPDRDLAKAIVLDYLGEKTSKFIQNPENAKLFYDLVKKEFNITDDIGKQLFGNNLKKLKKFKWIDATENIVNISESVVATLSSEWTTEFIIDVETGEIEDEIPTDGLVAYYPFNGNANDESGNENNGTVNGATLATNRYGNSNSAYSFDGIDDYISVGESYPNFGDRNPYSVSAWFKTDTENIGAILSRFNRNIIGEFILGVTSEGKTIFHREVPSFQLYGNSTINDNIWHHIVYWYDGEKRRIYIDGVLDGENSSGVSNSAPNEPVLIGNAKINGQIGLYQFKGIIDDLRVFNKALSEDEIYALFDE